LLPYTTLFRSFFILIQNTRSESFYDFIISCTVFFGDFSCIDICIEHFIAQTPYVVGCCRFATGDAAGQSYHFIHCCNPLLIHSSLALRTVECISSRDDFSSYVMPHRAVFTLIYLESVLHLTALAGRTSVVGNRRAAMGQ